jgi:hypothetical protein
MDVTMRSTRAAGQHQPGAVAARVRTGYPCAMANGSWTALTPVFGVIDHKPEPRRRVVIS